MKEIRILYLFIFFFAPVLFASCQAAGLKYINAIECKTYFGDCFCNLTLYLSFSLPLSHTPSSFMYATYTKFCTYFRWRRRPPFFLPPNFSSSIIARIWATFFLQLLFIVIFLVVFLCLLWGKAHAFKYLRLLVGGFSNRRERDQYQHKERGLS